MRIRRNYLNSNAIELLSKYSDRIWSDGTPDDPIKYEEWKTQNPTHQGAIAPFHEVYIDLDNIKSSEFAELKRHLTAEYCTSFFGAWSVKSSGKRIIIVCTNNTDARIIRDDIIQKMSENLNGSGSYISTGQNYTSNNSDETKTSKYLIYAGIGLAVIVVLYLLKNKQK